MLPKELHRVAKMNHVSIKVNFITFDKLYKWLIATTGITHTSPKINHLSIQVIALNFIKPSVFPQESYTLAKTNNVSVRMNFIDLGKSYKN